MTWYVGNSSSVAKKVKKVYVGVNGVARKVKKLYVGVNGIARKVFGGGELKYVAEIDSLTQARSLMCTVEMTDCIAFIKGVSGADYYATIDSYDTSLTHTVPSLGYFGSAARDSVSVAAAVSFGNYGIVAGGRKSSSSYSNNCMKLNSSFTYTSLPNLNYKKYNIGAANVGDYAVFVGGYDGTTGSFATTGVDTYTHSSGTHTTQTLPKRRQKAQGIALNDYAVFSGEEGSSSFYDYAFNSSLTRSNLDASGVSNAENFGAAKVGNYAIFAGGTDSSSAWGFDNSLTKIYPPSLNENKGYPATVSLDEYAVFSGGSQNSSSATPPRSSVNATYDTSLTLSFADSLPTNNFRHSGGVISNYVLFAGGVPSSNISTNKTYRFDYFD